MDTRRIADAARGLRHVFIRDLTMEASIGVHPHEHAAAQRVRINVDLGVADDAARATSSGPSALSRGPASRVGRDELARVVDYQRVAERVRAIVNAGHVRLVETLAERIAEGCFDDSRVELVRVRVEKLDVFADTASVGVEIERRRG